MAVPPLSSFVCWFECGNFQLTELGKGEQPFETQQLERLFRRLNGYRRVTTRYENLDALFLGFIIFALVVESLK